MSKTKALLDELSGLDLGNKPKGFDVSLKLTDDVFFVVVVLTDDTYVYALNDGELAPWGVALSLQDLRHSLSVEASEWESDRS